MVVKMEKVEERFWYLFTRYLSKESSLEENEELKDIVSGEKKYKQLFEQNGRIWHQKDLGQVNMFDKELIKKQVLDQIRSEDTKPAKHQLSLSLWSLVALFLVIVGIGTFSYMSYDQEKQDKQPTTITKSTDEHQRAMFILRDGTKIWLHENSSIAYQDQLEHDGIRQVQLTGEAYFNVTKNPNVPFIVKTGNISTKVLGTTFNVRAFPQDDVEVTVETGKVLVENQHNEISLKPNEQAVVSRKTNDIMKNNINSAYVTVWKNPDLEFDMIPLKEAFFMMERYYNVKIITDSKSDLSCTVRSIYKGEKLETVLQGLQLIFHFDYEMTGDSSVIKITKAAC